MSRHVLWGLFGAAFACLLFWLFGFDFNERGLLAGACAFMAVFLGGCCYGASRDLDS
jgi:hypothetical protein